MDFNFKSLIPGKTILAHSVCWFGNGHDNYNDFYSSADPKTIARKLDLMQSVGIDGVIQTWQGTHAMFTHEATIRMCLECAHRGMLFGLLMDPEVGRAPGMTKEASVMASLNDRGTWSMLNSPTYLSERYLLDFNTGADFSKVTLPAGVKLLKEQVGYGWPNAYKGDNARSLKELVTVNTHALIPGVCFKFNDGGFKLPDGTRDFNRSVYAGTPVRWIDSRGGQFFRDTVAALPAEAKYVGIVTWDDYGEGTAVEANFGIW